MGWRDYEDDYDDYSYDNHRRYVPLAERRADAMREVARRKAEGVSVSPVKIDGLTIAESFWGKAWCNNLEAYSDYRNRLPRGRTYVRNGSVVDLQITPTKITALVSGSELYEVEITISAVPDEHWSALKSRCGGEIGTLVELLQGKLSRSVMDVVTQKKDGLFPKPAEIKLYCSCPDGASMCKHVAATMYGVGARLDAQPELLFHLRKVDHLELIQGAGVPTTVGKSSKSSKKTLATGDLADVFGIEFTEALPPEETATPSVPAKPAQARRIKSPVAVKKAPKPVAASNAAMDGASAMRPASGTPVKTKRKKATTAKPALHPPVASSTTATSPNVPSAKTVARKRGKKGSPSTIKSSATLAAKPAAANKAKSGTKVSNSAKKRTRKSHPD